MLTCPLCQHPDCPLLAGVHGRDYHDCPDCRLVFMNPRDRISLADERAHYRLHQNNPDDPGYRKFLSKVADPLISSLSPGMRGLDYGCGPGPTLSVMLEEAGFAMDLYDPAFAEDRSVLDHRYDFVTCTETVEHFHHPAAEWSRLHRLVRPGGLLAVMTQPLEPDLDFAGWWYLRDPTHVSLYRPATLQWIADHWRMTLTRPSPTVWIFAA